MFSHLIGNEAAKRHLEQMLAHQTLPSVLLFHGPEGVGKSLFARTLAERLVKKSGADLHIYIPETLHTIESMRKLIQEAAMPPFESEHKVFIIEEAEKMQAPAANALLKTLEEPLADTFIFLVASELEQLLPTIVSRCRKVPFFPIAEEEVIPFLVETKKVHPDAAKKCAFFSEGSIGRALKLAGAKERFAVEPLLAAKDYAELHHALSKIDDKAEEEAERLEMADEAFEEILFYIREHRPFDLEKALCLVAEARLAVRHHVKLKNVLESFVFRLAVNPSA